jgi:hypothetical protein
LKLATNTILFFIGNNLKKLKSNLYINKYNEMMNSLAIIDI